MDPRYSNFIITYKVVPGEPLYACALRDCRIKGEHEVGINNADQWEHVPAACSKAN
ncbi:MAG TPA: hypothetical protein VGD60_06980 [Candidatus Acidoferrales bacterium]